MWLWMLLGYSSPQHHYWRSVPFLLSCSISIFLPLPSPLSLPPSSPLPLPSPPLLSPPPSPSPLQSTDICDHALVALKESHIRRVHLIGRRGPLQVAFTTKELREMTKLPGCRLYSELAQFDGIGDLLSGMSNHGNSMNFNLLGWGVELPRPRKRLTELMMKTARCV